MKIELEQFDISKHPTIFFNYSIINYLSNYGGQKYNDAEIIYYSASRIPIAMKRQITDNGGNPRQEYFLMRIKR